jgi:hypothetical protein
VKAVNPKRFTMNVAGILIRSGFADGEFFTADPESDSVLSVAGTDGEVATSVSYDSRWNIMIKTLQSGDANSVFSQLYNLKRRGNGVIGFFPVLFKHADTGEYLAGANCCFSRAPSVKQDRTATAREWKMLLAEGEYGYADLSAAARAIGGGG